MESICNLCPRLCNINRGKSTGFCGMRNEIKIARAALHFWEEPCISGSQGSGTVFFCGCNLKCAFCQNREISTNKIGAEVSPERLAEIFLNLAEQGAHNINLVTPTHFVHQIKIAADYVNGKLNIPIVYNCGGYESATGLEYLKDDVSIYLTDIKYADDSLAEKYSWAPNYRKIAFSALEKMLSYVGKPQYDNDGILQSGVIVRHLVLPGCRRDSIEILKRLKAEFGTSSFRLSLMSQFTPNGALGAYPELNRKITSFEYKSVTEAAFELGFDDAYVQMRSSASDTYIPPFDLTGIF